MTNMDEPNTPTIYITFPKDEDLNTDLHHAAAHGNFLEVKNELSKGQRIDSENFMGWTPLMMAVRNGHIEVAKLLLENKADASKKNRYGANVFLMAVAQGKLEVIHVVLQHLLKGGVSRLSLESTFSPLSLAILFDHQEVFTYLLNHMFGVNTATPNTGLTPMMFAAAMDNTKVYWKLLDKNADHSLRNAAGKTADKLFYRKEGAHPLVTVPKIIISPQPTFYGEGALHPSTHHLRKSSNVESPNFYISPQMTPFGPFGLGPVQVFFPPNFSPTQVVSPTGLAPCPQGVLSPHLNYFSPCVMNMRIGQNGDAAHAE